ncbi:LysR family transcriptional regulator [Bacteriovorax sp. Seq25_V]|uniref:LysR family transcriptional regulator n=1 Tax=Bacteriovorax sp. Seq25_V TaxID=1201288 RepID=UPI000389E749|nr:LysR family transcriptional regulator [Bacteriovorax sp. Seq25_V]EQC45302.1 LysR substrate-binding domain protein [Bacteriovorax sp. Seq25_V]
METIKNLGNIVAFTNVARFESFSLAAKEMGVSKSHLSKSVASLENELGQKLFQRSTRIVKLTAEGEKFYETCHEALKSVALAKENILNTSDTPQGLLRVTMAGVFAEEYIAPVAAKLAKLYPNLTIELSFNEKLVNLVKENFDLGIRFGKLEDSTLIARKIASRKEYICGSKEYFENHEIPKHPKELKLHQCVIGNNDLWMFRERSEQFSVKVKGNYKSNNGRALLKGALHGAGLARLPSVYVLDHLKNGELISVLDNYMLEEVPIWAIYPSKKNQSINVRVFIEEIIKNLEANYSF